jgi:hypothetical protein
MRKVFYLFFLLISYTGYGQLSIDVSSLGAVGDNSTVNTTIIQKAVDSVSNYGGGEVVINNGTYITSTIVLKSNVTLRVTSGTTLKALPNNSDYPDIPYNVRSWSDTYTQKSLIFAEDAKNIRITGGGTIDGNGLQLGYLSVSKNFRPFGLRLHEVDSLTIDSITLRQAPQWMGHITGCRHVHINAIKIYNQCFGSNDGIDIDCCRDVLVENSDFDTNDDCLPVKTHSDSICRDVLVRNCTMATYERAVKVGNESLGPLVNIRFQDITVHPSSFPLPTVPLNAIYCAIADGGSADSIFIERINVTTPSQTSVFVRLCNRGNQFDSLAPPPTVKYLRNVWFKDITAVSSTTIPCSVTGIPGHPAENIHFKNVVITVPGNGPVGTSSQPEMETTRPECNIWGNTLPSYGLYVRHVDGLTLDSFCVIAQAADVRPLYYFEDTSGIEVLNACSVVPTGITETNDMDISVYPNPTDGYLHISNLPQQAEAVVFYNITGEQVNVISLLGRNEAICNLSGFPAGVYYMNVVGKNCFITRKVVMAK